MARSFVRASSHYLENAAAVLTGYPFSLCCWFYSDDTTVSQTLMGVSTAGSDDNRFDIRASGAIGGDPITASLRGTTATVAANSSTGYSANTWHHAAGVYTSATSRAAFIDGGSKGTNTTSQTPSGMDRMSIGRLTIITPQLYMSGRIAEAAIWNVALADVEVAALGRGVHPTRIRPTALVAYWPLWGDDSPEPDWHPAGGTRYPMTVNSATKANHAPVAPRLRRWGSSPLIEVAAANSPYYFRKYILGRRG